MEQKIDGIAERMDAHAEQDQQIHGELTASIRRVHERVDQFIPEMNKMLGHSLSENAKQFDEKFSSLERTIKQVDSKAETNIASIRKASWTGVLLVLGFLTSLVGATIVFFLTYSQQISRIMERLGAAG